MLKRTKGYFLLTMLVLTGLAGRMHTNILTTKERHALVVDLKTSRNDFLKTVETLTPKQLNFRENKTSPSIKTCIYKLVSIENNLWAMSQTALRQENPSLKRTGTDEDLSSLVQQKGFQYDAIKFKNVPEALKLYKTVRADILKYVHTSTENVRGHLTQTSIGNFDAYQLMLLNTIYCNHFVQQIEAIKHQQNFPK
jgi:hypothetical protein